MKKTSRFYVRLLALLLCLTATIPQLWAQTYTVAGTNNGFLGADWSPSTTSNDMVRYGSTTYYYLAKTANVNSGSYAFKVCQNHAWTNAWPSSNYNYSVNSSGTQSIVYIFNTSGTAVSLFGPFKTLTVAGTTELTGANWDTGNTACDMTSSNGVEYTLTRSNITLSAGTHKFKVCQDHAWTNAWPSNDYELNISSAGNYDVTFSFNVLTKEVSAIANLVTPTPVTPHYYVTGDNGLGLNGFTFQPSLELTDPDEDGTYTYTSTVSADGTYNFVFANGQGSDWNNFNNTYRIGPTTSNTAVSLNTYHNTQLAGGDHGAYQVTVAAGTVTFHFNPTAMTFMVEGTAPVIIPDYYVIGDIFPNGWNTGASTQMTDNDNDGTYSWTSGQMHLDAGTNYQYKVIDSNGTYYPSGANATFNVATPGTYTVEVTIDSSNGTVNAVATLEQADPTYNYTFYVLPDNGTTPTLYLWGTNNNSYHPAGDWPGTTLSTTEQLADGNNWYKYTGALYANLMNAIVNNGGNGHQTTDIENLAPDTYYIRWNVNDNTYTIDTQAPTPAPTYDYTIYVRYKGNATPYMYLWDNSGDLLDGFPGTALTDANTFTTEVINGYTYYKYEVTGSNSASLSMILDEGSSTAQTQNLGVAPGTSYFTYGGGSTVSGPNPAADPATIYYAESDFAGWTTDGTQMSDNGDGSYSKTFTGVTLNKGTEYEYKVYGNDGTSEGVWIGDSNGNNATLTPDMSGTYTVTITLNSDGTLSHTLTMTTPATVYITGDGALGSFSCNNGIAMTYTSNGIYTYATTLSDKATTRFVFADGQDADWNTFNNTYRIGPANGNETYTINSGYTSTQKAGGDNGSYSVEAGAGALTFYFDAINMAYKVEGTVPPVIYYVLGNDANLFGAEWTQNAAGLMTDNGNGTYTWTVSNVYLYEGGTYLFKVNGDDDSWYPSDNIALNVTQNGTYNLTVNFDGTDVTYTLTPVSLDQRYTYNIYVRYEGDENVNNVFTHAWDGNGDKTNWPGLAFANMNPTTINGYTYYTTTFTSYDQTLGLLFNENGNTQTANLIANPGDNYYTYNGGSSVTGPTTEPDAEFVASFYVVGDDTNIFPNGWDMGANTVMTDNQDGTYVWTSAAVHLNNDTNYEYKVRGNDGSWHPESDNDSFSTSVPGSYTVEITYDSNSGDVNAVLTLIEADPLYLIGHANTQQWAANAGIQMTYNANSGLYTLDNVVLTEGSEFAFSFTLGSSNSDWSTLNSGRLNNDGDGGGHWLINESWYGNPMPYKNYVDDNHNWYVAKDGSYNIVVDPAHHTVTVTPNHTELFISYGVNWTYANNSEEMSSVDGIIYQTTINLNTGDYFLFSEDKTDNTTWGATVDGFEITDLMVGYAQTLVNRSLNNFHFTGTSGKYIVVVNLDKKTVTLRNTAVHEKVTQTKIYLQKTNNVTLDPAGGTYNSQTLSGKRGGIYAWNKLNMGSGGGEYTVGQNGPSNYTYEGEVMLDGQSYEGNNHLHDMNDTITHDGKQWYAWSVDNSICEFYFIRTNKADKKSQKVMRRAGEVWLTWTDDNAHYNRQDDAVQCDSLMDVTRDYYAVSASGVSKNAVMLEGHYYVYFTNTPGWEEVYCYAWNDNGFEINGIYAGKKCNFVGYDKDGYEVWCYDFGLMSEIGNELPDHIIFNDGHTGDDREQTGDLPFDNGACYDYLGTIYLGNSLSGIINTGIVNGPKYTVEDNLVGVYFDENAVTIIPIYDDHGVQVDESTVYGALYAKDMNNYAAKSRRPEGTTDYVYDICAHPITATCPGGSQIQIKRTEYDQSNWVKIVLSPNFDNANAHSNGDVTYDGDFDNANFSNAGARYLEQYVGHVIPGRSMSGNLTNNVNPQMHITNIAKPGAAAPYENNVYVTAHFNDSVVFTYVHQDWCPGEYKGVYRTVPHIVEENGEYFVTYEQTDEFHKMFYVAPKPQEIAFITWAVFKHDDPTVGTIDCDTEPSDPGEFYAPMDWKRKPADLWNGLDEEGNPTPYPSGTTYGPYTNGFMQYGAFQVNWSLYEGMDAQPGQGAIPWYKVFKSGQAYKILALIRYAYDEDPANPEYVAGVYGGSGYNEGGTSGNHIANAPRRSYNDTYADMNMVEYDRLNESKFIVFPLQGSYEDSNGDAVGNVTAVEEIKTTPTSKDIVSVRYYNMMGQGSDKPFDGINIVVTTYNDGSRTSKKVLR
jgi:hypothetical protein